MGYYDPPDPPEAEYSCPHNVTTDWINEVGWVDPYQESEVVGAHDIWYEVWLQECGECGEVFQSYHEEVRIEVTAREEMERERAA